VFVLGSEPLAEEPDDGSMMGVLVAALALSVVLLLVLLTLAVMRLRDEGEWDEDVQGDW